MECIKKNFSKVFVNLNYQGFSLVEILIVISIIGILSGFGLSFTNSLQKNTRDAQRSSDLSVLQSALQQYYADQGKYPNTLDSELANGLPLTNCSGRVSPCTTTKTYLSRVPKDPSGTPYYYEPVYAVGTLTNCDLSGGVENGVCHYYFLCSAMENETEGNTCRNSNYNFQLTPL